MRNATINAAHQSVGLTEFMKRTPEIVERIIYSDSSLISEGELSENSYPRFSLLAVNGSLDINFSRA